MDCQGYNQLPVEKKILNREEVNFNKCIRSHFGSARFVTENAKNKQTNKDLSSKNNKTA